MKGPKTMRDKHSKTHVEIALAIKAGKKKLFKQHRAGMDLNDASYEFLDELTQMFNSLDDDGVKAVDRSAKLHEGEEELTETHELASAVHAILNDANTPAELFNKVSDFVFDCVNIKDAEGESLLDRLGT
jgi:hypothetical protein